MPTEPDWLNAREDRAWRAFMHARDQLNAHLNQHLLQDAGLSGADYEILAVLSGVPEGRMPAQELGALVQWEKSRLSHQLTRMQQRGLVERSNCAEDRRGAWIRLTAQGRSAVEAAAPRHVESVRRYLFDVLSAEQVDALGSVARAVLDRIDEQCAGRDVCESADTASEAGAGSDCDGTGMPSAAGCTE